MESLTKVGYLRAHSRSKRRGKHIGRPIRPVVPAAPGLELHFYGIKVSSYLAIENASLQKDHTFIAPFWVIRVFPVFLRDFQMLAFFDSILAISDEGSHAV